MKVIQKEESHLSDESPGRATERHKNSNESAINQRPKHARRHECRGVNREA